jgi:hypothetical protein
MDANIPAEKIKLLHDWPGWWSKIELFRPDLPCGRTLYLDLDIHIVDSLQPILDSSGDLVMFPTPHIHKKRTRKDENGWTIRKYQASTILFTPASLTWIYNKFKEKPEYYMNKYRSEQDIYAEWIPNQPMFKSQWLTKINQIKKTGKIDKDTIIISGNIDGEYRDLKFAPWINKLARQ